MAAEEGDFDKRATNAGKVSQRGRWDRAALCGTDTRLCDAAQERACAKAAQPTRQKSTLGRRIVPRALCFCPEDVPQEVIRQQLLLRSPGKDRHRATGTTVAFH
jgi:hypothetical protein